MSDRDFPIPGYLLNVSGYMVIEEDKLVANEEIRPRMIIMKWLMEKM